MATTETVHKLLIGGEWYETGETIDVTSPYDGSVVGRVAYGGADDARRAIDAAEQAMKTPLPAHKRAAVLDGVAELLRERRDEFARTIAEEAGKPLTTAGMEVDRAVQTMTFSALEARRHDCGDCSGRRVDHARGQLADAHFGELWPIDREVRA